MNPPVANDRTSDPDELQLPVLGLYADMEMGCGSVLLPDEFLRCSSAVRLEIIGGWQRSLARYAHDALLSLHAELAARQPQLSAAEHKALLLSTCATLGITVPADWTAAPAKN
jgi:hypothetical protein